MRQRLTFSRNEFPRPAETDAAATVVVVVAVADAAKTRVAGSIADDIVAVVAATGAGV